MKQFVLFFLCSSAFAGEAQLTWTAPTENEDGSPYTDPSHYTIRVGCTQSGVYDEQFIDNIPYTITDQTVSALPAGTCYFVATAVNQSGIESAYSNEAQKVIVGVLPDTITVLNIEWQETQTPQFGFRGAAASDGFSETATVTHNLPIENGDLVVAMVNRNNSGTAITLSGFTEIHQADGAESSRYAVGFRIANNEPATYQVNLGVNQSYEFHLLACSGTFTGQYVFAVDTDIPPVSGVTASPGIAVCFVQADTVGNDYTGFDAPWTAATLSQNSRNAASAYQLMPNEGGTGDCVYTSTGSLVDHGIVVAIQ